MGRFTLEDTPLSGMKKMSEGIPGAAVVLGAMFAEAPKIDPQAAMGGLYHIMMLDDLKIYGSDIWILYKYVCNQDMRLLVGLIRAYQQDFITETELKAAIAGKNKHTLDVVSIVAKVEAELDQFQKAAPVTIQ